MAGATVSLSSHALAAGTTVRGTIVSTQGHEVPACRTVALKRKTDGVLMYFRIPTTGVEDGIMATTITALTTRREVEIYYDPAATTGCGTEPRIQFISLFADG
ncbi:hypothetical protein ASD79_09350 [Caulobacter sp. Root655]|nr:hypothetical protein ASD79_09350 [Caulobacter sp. Root655]